MFRSIHRHLASTCAAASLLVAPAQLHAQITLQLLDTLDGFELGTGVPAAITVAPGGDLFVSTLGTGSVITRVTNPLGIPANGGTLGTGGPATGSTNGFVSLNTDGTTLVAATNNGGGDPDVVQSFDIATGALNFETDSATLNAPISGGGNRFDGAAVDPLTGNIFITAFGSGFAAQLDASTGSIITGTPTSLFTGTAGTGFRDLVFNGDGDIFIRATNGIAGGARNLEVGQTDFDDFTTFESLGAVAGLSGIAGDNGVNIQDSFQSAINIEFLPASFTGADDDVVITNTRVSGSTAFADQVLAFDSDAGFDGMTPFSVDTEGVPVAIDFLDDDGVTPFETPESDADSGIYDFSFDPVNEVLYISDLDTGVIFVFGQPPEDSGVIGDYNNNGTVDAADYTVWRDNLGEAIDLPNDTTPGSVTNEDYAIWASNFGASTPPEVQGVPEPTACVLVSLSALAGVWRRRRQGECGDC